MKNLISVMCVFMAMLGIWSCSDDTPYVSDGDYSGYREFSANEILLNGKTGMTASDKDYIYFQYHDGKNVTLYKKDRKTGKKVVLDYVEGGTSTSSSLPDLVFLNMFLRGDYLYYMIFDGYKPYSETRMNIYRIRTDNSSPRELIYSSSMGGLVYYVNDRIYFSYFDLTVGYKTVSMDMDGGDVKFLFYNNIEQLQEYNSQLYFIVFNPESSKYEIRSMNYDGSNDHYVYSENSEFAIMTEMFISDGKIYYFYREDGESSAYELKVMNPDGTGVETLVDNIRIKEVCMYGDKIYFWIATDEGYALCLFNKQDASMTQLYTTSKNTAQLQTTGYGEVVFTVVENLTVNRYGDCYLFNPETNEVKSIMNN